MRDSEMLHIRLKRTDIAALKALAEQDERTVPSLVRFLVREYLNNNSTAQEKTSDEDSEG